jgi:hypothetical protein
MRGSLRRTLSGIGLLSFVTLIGVGCGGSASTDDIPDPGTGGFDAGARADSGAADGGSGRDASGSPDATALDASGGSDAGAGGDAGTGGGADAGGPLTCNGSCPPGFYDLDNSYGPTLPNCGCEYACTKVGNADPIDGDFKDDNCDGSDGLVERCVYVSNAGTDAQSGGGRTSPVKTIPYAIDLAFQRGGYVCLGAETFEGAFTLRAGVNVYGGFDAADANFVFARRRTATSKVQATGYVIDAPIIDRATEVAGLTIVSKEISASLAGQTSYGIRIGNASGELALRWNDITAAAGTPGANGTDGATGGVGATGVAGSSGCECAQGFLGCVTESCGGCGGRNGGARVCTSCGGSQVASTCSGAGGTSGFGGGSGQRGASSSAGASGGDPGPGGDCSAFSASGAPPGQQGSGGASGETGTQGVAASGAGSLASDGRFVPAVSGGGATGLPGAGGGGGGGGGGTGGAACCDDSGGGGGSGGAGGCGGTGGTGGTAGGGSLPVTCASGRLVLEGNVLRHNAGGRGGNGGVGGSGGRGGVGGNGGGFIDDSGGGGRGGDGGGGGRGGSGAGGNGGPASCVATKVACATTFPVTGATANTCVRNGAGGQGGVGGSGAQAGQGGPSQDLLNNL